MSYVFIDAHDALNRYATVTKGFNQRWPAPGESAGSIYICSTPDEAIAALKDALGKWKRPTLRSGGHCYEGFVSNNPGGAIIDVGLMTGIATDVTVRLENNATHTYGFQVLAGNQNWDAYANLYKRTGKTLPGGSCYSVGFGGHIVGGGYGGLSRWHGLTVDWLSGVDIVVVDAQGTVRSLHANAMQHADLFKLCRGGGGGNVGMITSYYFDDMPVAPQQVALMTLQFPWFLFRNDKAQFGAFLNAYAQFMISADTNPRTYGLFTGLGLTHVTAGGIWVGIQYSDENGGLTDLGPLNDFIQAMSPFGPKALDTYLPGSGVRLPFIPTRSPLVSGLPAGAQVFDWLFGTQASNGSGNNQRGKYKSSYMKSTFTQAEIDALFQYLTVVNASDGDFAQSLVQIDSYGGAINHVSTTNNGFDPANNQTAVAQRKSILKLQYQTYWTDPANDSKHLSWLRDFYYAVHATDGYNGTPYPVSQVLPNSRYEGCYINYPDVDMLTGKTAGLPGYSWGELYYPGIYSQLVATKQQYDPHNIFNHAMSLGVA